MNHHRISEVSTQRAESQKSYLEFLRTGSLSIGLYVLRAGEEDPQQPHSEDEVYYVIRGRGRFKAGNEISPIGRTRTWPSASVEPDRLRFAFAKIWDDHEFDNNYADAGCFGTAGSGGWLISLCLTRGSIAPISRTATD